MRRIVAAAVLLPNGLIVSVEKPGRHFHVVHRLSELGIEQRGDHEQGFLTNLGEFVRRKPARRIAEQAGQLLKEAREHSELFSEDVW